MLMIIRGVRVAAEWWALVGGALLIAAVLLTATSAAGNIFFNKPVSGDFEFVEIAVAVAVFCFLPHCQARGANVCADIFTARLNTRALAVLRFIAAFVAAAFALLLFWRMGIGMSDYRADGEITHTLGFPVWLAFPPMLFSLLLLFVTAVADVYESCVCLANKNAQR